MTPAILVAGLVSAAVVFTDPLAQQLAADMRRAIHLACQTPTGISIDLKIPLNKLYDQLNGNAPFTYLWRILAAFPDVKLEFYDIQTARVNALVIRVSEVRDLVTEVKQFTAGVRSRMEHRLHKRMAKASLPHVGRKAQAV